VRAATAVGTVAAAGVVLIASWQAGQHSGPQAANGIRVVSGASASRTRTQAPSSAGRSTRPVGSGSKAPGASSSTPPARRTVTGALVSGATYTSEGYRANLQAALDSAHL
jgi:hypothetical protein